MKPSYHGLFLMVSLLVAHASAELRAELPSLGPIYPSVFQIIYGSSNGTAFTIEVDNRQYLITAEHVVHGIKKGDEIVLMKTQGKPKKVTVVPIPCENTNVVPRQPRPVAIDNPSES